jgi:hypothetical protein
MSTKDWERKTTGPAWGDVWAWCEDVREEYGYWVSFVVQPPLPSVRKVAYNITMIAARLSGQVAGGTQITRHHAVGHSARVNPETVALQMVSELYVSLDRERYAAEAAAGEGTLPL